MQGYSAFNLTKDSKAFLLEKFCPSFSKVIAHHVTYKFNVSDNDPLPKETVVKVVGYAKNSFIECVVVEVNGDSERPDGKIYHITISHKEGHKPVESNDLLTKGYTKIDSFDLGVEPYFNKF